MPWFSPKNHDFLDLFVQASDNLVKGVRLFRELLDNPGHMAPYVERIKEVEHEGDRFAHEAFAKLSTTFITPFDREDIHALTSRLDDILDGTDAAAQRLLLFRIEAIPSNLIKLTDILVQSTTEVRKAVVALHDSKRHKETLETCVEINRLENEADVLHRQALAELFADCSDAVLIIKLKDLYAFLETATDRCEDVANVIESIILKAS